MPQKSPRRLPLGSLRVFVAVAQHLNFTRAADALGVTTGAASLQIRALEDYLGQPLFRRSGRQVGLTSEGAALLPRVQHALQELELAIDDSRGERGSGALRVSMIVSFLQHWLLPRLPRLRSQYPLIDLHIDTSRNLVDFVHDDHHAAIRLGSGGWANVQQEKLLDEWLVPVCTPELHAKFGPVSSADDLARYTLVHSTGEPWTSWLLPGRIHDDSSSPFSGARIDDSSAIVRCALQGYGLALTRWSLVADEIAAGKLVMASPRPVKFARSYWFVWPQRVNSLDALVKFREWLRGEMQKFPLPPGVERAAASDHGIGRVAPLGRKPKHP